MTFEGVSFPDSLRLSAPGWNDSEYGVFQDAEEKGGGEQMLHGLLLDQMLFCASKFLFGCLRVA